MTPNRKWLDLGLALAGAAVWLVFRQILNLIWDFFRLPVLPDLPVSIPEVLAFLAGVATFIALRRHPKVKEFGLEVLNELAKVTWPTRKETVISTGVIMVMVGIAAVLLFVFDTAWGTLTRSFLEF